ncbi:MAG: MarR family winged helix-turn-helix transcriptional regulator [Chloroflexia bacterium]
MDGHSLHQEELRRAVEAFWETIAPLWQRIRAHIRQVASEQYGISVEQFHILRHIRRGEGSVSDLAQAKRVSRAAISQAVDTLVERGLIARTLNPADRRNIRLTLTPEGASLLDAIFEETRSWMMELLAPLSTEELQTLLSAMQTLRRLL